ncbi:putative protein kinase RLK-Pelle-LysM family [Medicago truncatula]|nr:putative protein kinase RLK-Pelle-LysM family [Medicago truncatula]
MKGALLSIKAHTNHSFTSTSMRIMVTLFSATILTLILLLNFHIPQTKSQQEYLDNHQLDCDDPSKSTYGNICNSINSCQSYLTFKSSPPHYNTPATIAYLLNSTVPLIANANNISYVDPIPTDTMITVPVNCYCSGHYYQHNSSYTLKTEDENYFTLANNTYESLTTCQALDAQNIYGLTNLTAGLNMHVPLRCACPTSKQIENGFKYILTYLVSEGEYPELIAEIFGVDSQSVLDANKLIEDQVIFYFTPLMVPLKDKPPTKIQRTLPPPSTPLSKPHVENLARNKDSSSSKKWVVVGIAVGAAFLLLIFFVLLFCFCQQHKNKKKLSSAATKTTTEEVSNTNTSITNPSFSLCSEGLRYAFESLTVYEFEELHKATSFFSEANRIRGSSAYRASLKGDDAAVKVLKGDVSVEINILRRINHANITRISGLSVHKGSTYLVYEFAENGSLDDWIHFSKCINSVALTWKQRVQIAQDVADALNYLHNYVNPPHIHKNLKSDNVLLDGNFRGKLCNFGLARVVDDYDFGEEGFQFTRHVVGTHGYMPPEYIENGLVSPKMDVFAFGVVMLELLSGREAIVGDKNGGEKRLSAVVSEVLEGDNVREKLHAFMDPTLRGEYPLNMGYSMAEIAKRCVANYHNLRPNVSEVLVILSKIQSSSVNRDPSDVMEKTFDQISDWKI